MVEGQFTHLESTAHNSLISRFEAFCLEDLPQVNNCHSSKFVCTNLTYKTFRSLLSADPEEVHAQLGVQNCELSSQPPIMKQELEEIEDTPYAGVTCKMMSEFRRMGICGTSTGVESSPAVLVDQHP